MAPEYIAKKSAWRAFTPFRILFIWLIIPLFLIIYDIVKLKSETIAFYSNKVVQRRGILSKNRKKAVFIGVLGVDVYQSLFGILFNYGDVYIDIAGKWDISTNGIKNPYALQEYLETRLIRNDKYTFLA